MSREAHISCQCYQVYLTSTDVEIKHSVYFTSVGTETLYKDDIPMIFCYGMKS